MSAGNISRPITLTCDSSHANEQPAYDGIAFLPEIFTFVRESRLKTDGRHSEKQRLTRHLLPGVLLSFMEFHRVS